LDLAPRRKYKRVFACVGVYGILNQATGKWYIGSSIALTKRWSTHLWALRSGRHHSLKLQRSFDKHGEAAFEFHVLVECAKEEIDSLENEFIAKYNAVAGGYNVAAEAKGGFMRGRKWPEATKPARVERARAYKATDETKQLLAENQSAAWANPEQRKKMMEAQRRPKSKEGAANIAATTRRRYEDPLAREKQAERMKRWWAERNGEAPDSKEDPAIKNARIRESWGNFTGSKRKTT